MGPEPSEDWEGWMKWDPIEDTLDSPRLPVQTSTTAERRPPSSKKRKSLSEDDDEDVRAPSSPGKARPSGTRKHNIVEKRYRTNINQRITALRDSIPSLRPVRGSKTQLVETEGSPTQKSNKATVLSTAVGYIQDLEKDKRRLENEIAQLKASLRAMKHADTIAAEHDKAPYVKPIAESSNQSQISTCSSTSSSESSKPVQGMIQVPEEMRRLRTSTTQIPFAQRSYIEHGESGTEAESTIRMGESSSRSAKFVGKLIVGSFAGLMVMQGFGESQTERKTVRKRSLLAVPAQQFWTKGRAILVQHTIEDGPPHFHVLSVLLKIYIVLVVCGFGIFLYAFLSKPKKKMHQHRSELAPSLASPLEVRRNAWLTAIQTVRVPRHKMFPEWAAVNLEALQYVVRHIIGWLNYAWLTGTSEEDEVARVRAWDIAIDAQLMGGDSEISGSRLILTILASGTLPRSPARLILKAIHLRILLWKAAGLRRSSVWLLVHRIAASLARYQWRLAQDLDREPVSRSTQPAHDVESLPEHLSALLQLSCAEALTDTITQRAHNLAWSRPTREDVCGTSDEMDLVVEDFTIRSPHDALAAWVSSATLQKALYAKLSNIGHETSELDWDFGIALHTAPPASIAQARALATNAVFVEANRQSALRMLLQDFMSKDKPERFDSAPSHTENTAFIDSSLPKAVRDDVLLATSCAFALGSMRKAGGQRQHLKQALRGVCNGYRDAKALTWLSFGTAYYLIHVVRSAYQANDLYKRELQQISSRLRSWLQVLGTSDCVIDQETVTDIEIRLSSNIVAEKGVSDTLSCDTAQPTEDLTQGRDSTAQPTQGFPAIITEADPALSKTSSFTDLPSLLHENPGVWLPKSKDRRPSHCSEDSGYGSTAA